MVKVVGRLELKAAPRTRGRGRAGSGILALMMSAADHRSQATSLDSDRQECGGADASCDRGSSTSAHLQVHAAHPQDCG